MRVDHCSEATITHNLIESNIAVQGSGIWVFNNGQAVISHNIIKNNIATGDYSQGKAARGAGIAIGAQEGYATFGEYTKGYISIFNNEIYGNKVLGYNSEVAALTPTGTFTPTTTVLPVTPTPKAFWGYGGGLYVEGYFMDSDPGRRQKIKLFNNIIYNNYAGYLGAAMSVYRASMVESKNNTFYNNYCYRL